MKTVLLLLIFSSTSCFSCSRDNYDDYIGYWERKDAQHHDLFQIFKDGDSLLMNDNILNETDDRFKKAMVLRKLDGRLSIANGFSAVNLCLSEDGRALRVVNQVFIKVPKSYIEELTDKSFEDQAQLKNKAL